MSALTLFDVGINNFFKTPINNIVNNSTQISNIYINDLKNTLDTYTKTLAINFAKKKLPYKGIIEVLKNEQIEQKLNFILFKNTNAEINVIYQTPYSSNLQQMLIYMSTTDTMIDISAYEIEGYIVAVRYLGDNLFLATTAPIDDDILKYHNNIKIANEKYMELSSERFNIKMSFVLLFCNTTFVVILLAVFIGIIYSRKVIFPVNKVISVINDVSSGDYETFIKLKKQNNEWDELIATFNNMIKTIKDNRKQVAILNKQNAWKDMARKMAHEIKNPLTPILLSVDRLKNKYRKEIITSPEIFDTCVNTIIRQVNNINDLVKEFSEFARLPKPVLKSNDLIKLLDEIIFMIESAHNRITFKRRFQYSELIFKFDATQISQAIVNVIINAVNIILENTDEIPNNTILVSCCLEDDNVSIIIEDSGVGFSEIVLEKAFEPYYTTRKNGTGLGLAIVFKIINDHNGHITLENSEMLCGAKVTLTLPYIV